MKSKPEGHALYHDMIGPRFVGLGFLIGILFGVAMTFLALAVLSNEAKADAPFTTAEVKEIDLCMANVVEEYSGYVDSHGGFAVFQAISVDAGWCVWRVMYGSDSTYDEYLGFLDEYLGARSRGEYPVFPIFEHEF